MSSQRKSKSRSPRKAASNSSSQSLCTQLRHWGIWLLTSLTVALQTTSCGLAPTTSGSSTSPSVYASRATRFQDCPQFFAAGAAPRVPDTPKLRELCYESFAVLHNGNTHTPMFVAERLSRQSLLDAQGEHRTDKFFADARLPRAERSELSDYKGSGYARGHMAPAGDMPNPTAMAQGFSLANIVPQNPKHNSGPWSKIEQDTRHYVMRAKGDVYVITGPVFTPESPSIGGNQVRVPTHLFKLVYDAQTKRAWAHWQQNAADAQVTRPISYGELEQRTGLDLLPGVEIR